MEIGSYAVVKPGNTRQSWGINTICGHSSARPISKSYHAGQLGRVKDAVYVHKLSGDELAETTLLLSGGAGSLYVARFMPREYEIVDDDLGRIIEFYKGLKGPDAENQMLGAIRDYSTLKDADLRGNYPEGFEFMSTKEDAQRFADVQNQLEDLHRNTRPKWNPDRDYPRFGAAVL